MTNKYSEYDLTNGITQIKIGLFGILDSFVSDNVEKTNLSPHVSIALLIDCAHYTGWTIDSDERKDDSVHLVMSNRGVTIDVIKQSYESPIKIYKR